MSDYVDTDCIMGPVFESSSEEARHHTCCMLILGVCTNALRKYLSFQMSDRVEILRRKMDENEAELRRLFTKKQMEKVFVQRKTSFGELDFSLIYTLLRNICSLSVSGCKWGETPNGRDDSLIACCERIREMRNEVVHMPMPEIKSKDLENYAEKARMVVKAIERAMSETFSEEDSTFLKHIDFYVDRRMECNGTISMELLDALEIKKERIDTLENKVDSLERSLGFYSAELEKRANFEGDLNENDLQENMKSILQEEINKLQEVFDLKLEKSMQELQRNMEEGMEQKQKAALKTMKTKSEKLTKDVRNSCSALSSLKRKCDEISNDTSTEIEALKRKTRKVEKAQQETTAKLNNISEDNSTKMEKAQQDVDAKLKNLEKKCHAAIENQDKKSHWNISSWWKK